MKSLILVLLSFIFINSYSKTPMTRKFNHDRHITKVFSVKNYSCTECHNLEKNSDNGFKAIEDLEKSTFKKTPQKMCHSCHQGSNQFPNAPKDCTVCHDTINNLEKIIPLDHKNTSWKSSHAQLARNDSSSCLKCHIPNQCINCHSSKNPVTNTNHSKNFRYFHSIEARMNPTKCDSCHSENYCMRCHLGGLK